MGASVWGQSGFSADEQLLLAAEDVMETDDTVIVRISLDLRDLLTEDKKRFKVEHGTVPSYDQLIRFWRDYYYETRPGVPGSNPMAGGQVPTVDDEPADNGKTVVVRISRTLRDYLGLDKVWFRISFGIPTSYDQIIRVLREHYYANRQTNDEIDPLATPEPDVQAAS